MVDLDAAGGGESRGGVGSSAISGGNAHAWLKLAALFTLSVVIGWIISTTVVFASGIGTALGYGLRGPVVNFAECVVILSGALLIEWSYDSRPLSDSSRQRSIDYRNARHMLSLLGSGVSGAVFICGSTVMVEYLPLGVLFVVIVLGQMTAAIVIDHFGLFGAMRIPVTVLKVVASVIVLAGAVLVQGVEAPSDVGLFILYVVVTIVISFFAPLQSVLIMIFGGQVNFMMKAPLYSQMVSAATAIVAAAFTYTTIPALYDGSKAPWYMWLTGLGAAAINTSFLFLPKALGSGPFFIALILGQLCAAITYDSVGAFDIPRSPLTYLQGIGIAVAVVGAGLYQWELKRNRDAIEAASKHSDAQSEAPSSASEAPNGLVRAQFSDISERTVLEVKTGTAGGRDTSG
jgi:transporter family-2 protein